MNIKTRQAIDDLIGKHFYYIEYPGGLDKYFWKDENGKLQFMLTMSKAEIENCIKRINADIDHFQGGIMETTIQKAFDAILPLALNIKNELKEQLEYKIQEEHEDQQQQMAKYLQRLAESPLEPRSIRSDPALRSRKITVRVKLPQWMISRLASEGELSHTIEKYLKQSGIVDRDNTKPSSHQNRSSSSSPEKEFAEIMRKDVKNILNSSLNAILGFAQLALSPFEWPRETMNNYLKSIEKTAQRMKREIDKL